MVGSFTAWIVFLFLACVVCFFFFSSRRRHTRFDCDWSSDVCSSDLMIRHTRFDCDWSSDVCSSDLFITGAAHATGGSSNEPNLLRSLVSHGTSWIRVPPVLRGQS